MARSDVTPRLPLENISDVLRSDAVFYSQRRGAPITVPSKFRRLVLRSDSYDLRRGQFGFSAALSHGSDLRAGMLRAPISRCCPTFSGHIVHVLLVCPQPQMRVFYAGWGVSIRAIVKNIKVIRDRAVRSNPGEMVSSKTVPANIERSVPCVVQIASKQQAGADALCLPIESSGVGRQEDTAASGRKTTPRRAEGASYSWAPWVTTPQTWRGIIQPWHGPNLLVTTPPAVCTGAGVSHGNYTR